jgi:hypothetical protein
MQIKKSFVPYEYIVFFNNKSILLLAKEEDENIVPADSLLKVEFSENINSNIIKNNLYYHLKYNNVNMDVLKFKCVKSKLR